MRRVRSSVGRAGGDYSHSVAGSNPVGLLKCEAKIDDYDRPAYQASMQRITAPGVKRCTRNAKVKLGDLCLCAAHARLAHEGFVDEGGNVVTKNSIADVRRSNDRRRSGTPLWKLHKWSEGLQEQPLP